MAVCWDLPGPSLSLGQRVNVVVQDLGTSDLFKGLWHGDTYCCKGLGAGVWTLLGFQVLRIEDSVILLAETSGSVAVPKPQLDRDSVMSLRDIGAGIGGMSVATCFAGCTTILAVDKCVLAYDTLLRNHLPALQGDISLLEVHNAILRTHAGRSGILSISLSLKPPALDEHNRELLRPALVLAWRLQADCIILESNQDVSQCSATKALLSDFAAKRALRLSAVQLDLADQWASRRHRWWYVLLPEHLPRFDLRPWTPCSPKTLVGDVTPEFPCWPTSEEESLAWSDLENEQYTDPRFGSDCRLLDLQEQAPLAQHGWGSAHSACPCGCRPTGFSVTELATQGLCGYGVLSCALEGLRFPHAAEVGFLNSLPAMHLHLPDARAALCLVGGLTAPLQALWIYGLLLEWSDQVLENRHSKPPAELVESFKGLLHQSRLDHWRLPSLECPGTLWLGIEGIVHSISIPGPTRVEDVVAAEKVLAGPGHSVHLIRQGSVLPGHALLRPSSADVVIELRILPKASRKAPVLQDAQVVVGTSDVTIWTGLLRLQAALPTSQCFIVPPRQATALLECPSHLSPGLAWPAFAECCLLAFVDKGHWSLLALFRSGDGATAQHFDGVAGRSEEAANSLASKFCRLCSRTLHGFKSLNHWVQAGPNECGALTLAHAAVVLTDGPAPERCQAFCGAHATPQGVAVWFRRPLR